MSAKFSALLAMMLLAGAAPARLVAQQPGGASASTATEPGSIEDDRSPILSAGQPAHDPWRVELRAWAWLMGVEGDVGVRGRVTEVSASFSDILDGSDSLLAFSGRIEVGYEKFGAYLDGMYADVGAEDQTGTAGRSAVDVEFEQTIIDFGLMYRVADFEPRAQGPASNVRNLTIDLYAGGRFNALEIEIDPDRLPPRNADEDWLDPIIGAKGVLPLAEHWHAELNGDIGGFGVSSDLTWSATAVIGYDFTMFGAPASVLLGYRVIGWDYSEGGGAEEFTWDVFQHGIILGLDVRF